MYSLTLAAHSLLRWVLLALATTSTIRSFRRFRADEPWAGTDEVLARFVMISFFLQLALGYLIYAEYSPITTYALKNLGRALADPQQRFFVAIHPVAMVVAFVVLSAGRVRTQAPGAGVRAHRDWLAALVVGGLLVLATIPWPGLTHGRPLFRLP